MDGAGNTTRVMREFLDALSTMPTASDDAERIDRIRLLEELKSVAAAAQARETAEFAASQRAAQAAAGVPAERVGRGIAAQVGLARRISPFHAQRYVGWAGILTTELPATFAALRAGRVSEWRAMLLARESAWLSAEHRAVVDAELAPRLENMGDRRVEAEARKLGYRLDPHGYLARTRGATNDRHVGIRPAPDVMCRLTGFLPVAQGVAAYAALMREADSRIAAGDARGRGQIMADTLVERLTGQAAASDVPVAVNLVMTDHTLFGGNAQDNAGRPEAGADEPAHLDGYGPVPADTARSLVYGADEATPMWLRRLYTRPQSGQLVAMESRRRCFTPAQRHFIRMRDQHCRTPYCDAPIRHIDHVTPAQAGGPTAVANGQGYCAACNFAKQAPGWNTETLDAPAEFVIITPTGHQYQHAPPDPPGTTRTRSPLEEQFAALLRAA